MTEMLVRVGLMLFRMLARLPYPLVRRLGEWSGRVAWWLAAPRRRIALTNLALCLPELSARQRRLLAEQHFQYFMRSFLERFIFWFGSADRIRKLVSYEGFEHFEALRGKPVILLAPHFCGIDAGGIRLQLDSPFASMYANQKSKVLTRVMTEGRSRFPGARMFVRNEGLRGPIRAIREGVPFYFLPDMDLGPRDAVFVPFFGIPAATVTSVQRLARLTGATVLPLVTTMTRSGYIAKFYPPWEPNQESSLESAARAMNAFIEARVMEMPAQYLWTHRRFKTRPPGSRRCISDNSAMRIKFSKMQGAGNDFVVIDAVSQRLNLTRDQWRRMADRHYGVGADQILVVEPSTTPGIDFRYRIFNVDGGEVEQCGNGARCFVRFVRDQGLTSRDAIRVQTAKGVIEPRLCADGRVTVDMGAPVFDPPQIPFDTTWLANEVIGQDRVWTVQQNGRSWKVSAVSMGNPHCVMTVDDVQRAPVLQDGPLLERHPAFPQRVNVGFMQVISTSQIGLRVFERGVGETLACGSGACAAVVVGVRRGLLAGPVEVQAQGGRLTVEWRGPGAHVMMTGPAETVFTGEIDI